MGIENPRCHVSNSNSGVLFIYMDITTSPVQISKKTIPANAIVTNAFINMLVVYSPGTLIQVGQDGLPALLMDTNDSVPDALSLNQYDADQLTPWGKIPRPVLVTVTGFPTVGSCICAVTYFIPSP